MSSFPAASPPCATIARPHPHGRERGFGLLQVNSNGLRLGLEAGYARKLREAGLDSVYLQWDSPDLEGCLPLRGPWPCRGLDLLAVKRRAVEQCTDAGLGVVLVATVVRGVNDDRLGPCCAWRWSWAPVCAACISSPWPVSAAIPDGWRTDSASPSAM